MPENTINLPDSFFQKLKPKAEEKFRQWARDHFNEVEYADNGAILKIGGVEIGLCHPCVRDELVKLVEMASHGNRDKEREI